MAKIPLAKTLACLREELRTAQAEAKESGDLWFLVEDIELELSVVVTEQAGGKVGFSVLGFEIGGDAGTNNETVQTLRLKLGPRGADKQKKVFAGKKGNM